MHRPCFFRALASHNVSGELSFLAGDRIWLRGFASSVHGLEIPTRGSHWGCVKGESRRRPGKGECRAEGWVPMHKLEVDVQ